ncbi:DUF1329 domain-containing protein [Pseudomonas sp. FME51]|uniref:DUF1329 domain-containing protein n=1 Tax=Pseudomonas sp. FME51 TaxID=2742609 RepID=UPI001866DC5A|nr:DUF1329 domain-containing protein [Pseudomonas sp. FME51]
MKLHFALSIVLTGIAAYSLAAVPAQEAAKLGESLTLLGAIQAGNEAGTIPPFEGGLREAPAGFEPGSGYWADPFKDEEPLFRIDASNYEQYAEQLSAGQIELLKRNPDTYYMDIYPSHRTAAHPQDVLDATVRNATTCGTLKDGLALGPECRGGIPFPIPQTGHEVMWNQQTRYNDGEYGTTTASSNSWIVASNGTVTKASEQSTFVERPYYQTDLEERDPQMYTRVYSVTKAPARRAGELTGYIDFLDPTQKPRRAWSYTPGQRRVKLAPEFAYDTPVASMGGLELFDELFMFSGMQDRFDFDLVGRKEMYIPYNNYELYFHCDAETQLMDSHVNPECERWELHRVWEVEATLKEGNRHVYSKRTYYLDEDTYGAGLYDAWDQSGQLYRSMMLGGVQLYNHDIPYMVKHSIYDFNKGMYGLINDALNGGYQVLEKPLSERELNPEAIVGRETVR